MKKRDYGGVKTLLAMENPIVRQGLQNSLQHEGYPHAFEVLSLDRMLAALTDTVYDVVITSTALGEEFVSPYLALVRQGAMTHHPLPIVIQLLADSDSEYVRRVIDSGPDDLLQLPVSPGALMKRISILAGARKPFVVTSDYVGPDRRQGARPGAALIPQIDVPNPLALKIQKVPDEDIAKKVADTADKLRQMRLERYAFELQWLLRAIRQQFEPENRDRARLETFCERIKTLLINLPGLLVKTPHETISPLAEQLMTGANVMMKRGFSEDETNLQGLGGMVNALSQAIRDTLSPRILEAARLAALGTINATK